MFSSESTLVVENSSLLLPYWDASLSEAQKSKYPNSDYERSKEKFGNFLVENIPSLVTLRSSNNNATFTWSYSYA